MVDTTGIESGGDEQRGFPYFGADQKMPQGWRQRRIAKEKGGGLLLNVLIEAPEVFSCATYRIQQSTGSITFSLQEKSYWYVPKDYGRVLLHQTIEAGGTVQNA